MDKDTMLKFYFTYGSNKQFPFQFGWTEIEAPTKAVACALFRAFHPDKDPDTPLLNCAMVYTEAEFKDTRMYLKGNHGKHCHELISLERRVLSSDSARKR